MLQIDSCQTTASASFIGVSVPSSDDRRVDFTAAEIAHDDFLNAIRSFREAADVPITSYSIHEYYRHYIEVGAAMSAAIRMATNQ